MIQQIIDVLSLIVIRSLVGLLAILPRGLAIRVSRFVVSLLIAFIPRSHGVGMRNLELIFPELSAEERERILRSSYNVLAENLLWFARLPQLSGDEVLRLFDCDELRSEMSSAMQANPGKGLLVATMHFGNFELSHHLFALFGKPAQILARGFGLPRLDAWWNNRRAQFGNRVFPRTGGFQSALSALSENKVVGVLADQNVKANHAIFADFFGIKAATTKTIALAAVRTGCPLFFAVAAELSPGRHKVYVRNISNLADLSDDPSTKILAITEAMHREMEAVIRAHPEQWFWIHRRFKTRPPGEAETLYSD